MRYWVDKFGACSVDNGMPIYHPLCLAFRTALWKGRIWSLEERWPGYDVAGELTDVLGGLIDDALLPRTRHAGPPIESVRDGKVHFFGEVYADAVSNMYCMSRAVHEPDRDDFDGWPRSEVLAFHQRWRNWAQAVLDGKATVRDLPAGEI